MVKDNFKDLPALSGPSQYQEYLRKRLETLSVRESYILAAVLQRAPPGTRRKRQTLRWNICAPAEWRRN